MKGNIRAVKIVLILCSAFLPELVNAASVMSPQGKSMAQLVLWSLYFLCFAYQYGVRARRYNRSVGFWGLTGGLLSISILLAIVLIVTLLAESYGISVKHGIVFGSLLLSIVLTFMMAKLLIGAHDHILLLGTSLTTSIALLFFIFFVENNGKVEYKKIAQIETEQIKVEIESEKKTESEVETKKLNVDTLGKISDPVRNEITKKPTETKSEVETKTKIKSKSLNVGTLGKIMDPVRNEITKKPTKIDSVENRKPNWVVQVASFAIQNNANTLRDKLKLKGYRVFIAAETENKKYRVRVGPVKTRNEAALLRSQLAKQQNLIGIVLKHR